MGVCDGRIEEVRRVKKRVKQQKNGASLIYEREKTSLILFVKSRDPLNPLNVLNLGEKIKALKVFNDIKPHILFMFTFFYTHSVFPLIFPGFLSFIRLSEVPTCCCSLSRIFTKRTNLGNKNSWYYVLQKADLSSYHSKKNLK